MSEDKGNNSLTNLQRTTHAQNNARRTIVNVEARPSCNALLIVQWHALIESHGRVRPAQAEALCVFCAGQGQVNQINPFSGGVMTRWNSAAAAAASLGVPVQAVEHAATRGSIVNGAMFSWAMPHGRTSQQTHPVGA